MSSKSSPLGHGVLDLATAKHLVLLHRFHGIHFSIALLANDADLSESSAANDAHDGEVVDRHVLGSPDDTLFLGFIRVAQESHPINVLGYLENPAR